MTSSDYINRAFRPEPGKKYYNHMATWARGEWHRHWLLTSGQYIRTSDPDMRKGYGWALVGEPGPELVNFSRIPYQIGRHDHDRRQTTPHQHHSRPNTQRTRRTAPGGHMNPEPRSPDCRDGNHHKCDGQAWDDTTDALASCVCTCHLEPTH